MKPLPDDSTTALLRAISVKFMNFAPVFEEIRSRSWASATFAGARHELGLRLAGEGAAAAADAFAENLESADFELRGHLLADIALVANEPTEDGVRLRIEALTVEDC
jgi:hypothetical protein